jgi:hypothetical protein
MPGAPSIAPLSHAMGGMNTARTNSPCRCLFSATPPIRCHPERSSSRSLRTAESKDLRLLLPLPVLRRCLFLFFAFVCSCCHSERVFRARRTPMNPIPPQPPSPLSHKIPAFAFCRREQGASAPLISQVESRGFSPGSFFRSTTLKNPSKSACQAPQPRKIPLIPTPSTTSIRKIVGIVVMLRLIQLTYGSNPSRGSFDRAEINSRRPLAAFFLN